jgi:hypothetical protein
MCRLEVPRPGCSLASVAGAATVTSMMGMFCLIASQNVHYDVASLRANSSGRTVLLEKKLLPNHL